MYYMVFFLLNLKFLLKFLYYDNYFIFLNCIIKIENIFVEIDILILVNLFGEL